MRTKLAGPGWLLLTAVLSSSGTVTGCASAIRNDQVLDTRVATPPATTITVHNQHLLEMRVIIVSGSAEYRLGQVSGMSTAIFKVPRVISSPSDVRFLTVSLASEESRSSEPVTVFAGDAVEFTIGSTRGLTSLFVRR
jgi:hypothetical protein